MDNYKNSHSITWYWESRNERARIKINFDETHLPPEALIEMIYGPLPYGPLPAQQISILDMGMDQPASMRRCVQKLIEAAGILLDDKNYDGTGHELISDARNNAIKYLADHSRS